MNYKLKIFSQIIAIVFCAFIVACEFENKDAYIPFEKVGKKTVVDPHSFSNFNAVQSTHLHLDLTVDFKAKKLKGRVDHQINQLTAADTIIFDTKDLNVTRVEIDGNEVSYFYGPNDFLLGRALKVKLEPNTKLISIFYETATHAEALMWLDPQQTAGKEFPFLFTQGEAILTRTWIPCQDAPSNRITYSAVIRCDTNLIGVMSAEKLDYNELGVYEFEMKEPIPTYLIALAVGHLTYAKLGDRTGVYAEPEMLDQAAYEFQDVEKMIQTAETLYGPYAWGQYDILVMPPSFPFGGMENPRLTFATPTIIAGDRSLVSLIAHELAHSWSGNLVTNSTWNDFWLNEGFTVYFENRIMEALYGNLVADMLMNIEYQELLEENGEIMSGKHPEDTKLKLDLAGRNPDDGMTSIAYVKGALFLQTIEELVGREKFDVFVKNYFQTHKFQTITTEEFISYLNYHLLEPNHLTFNTEEWVYQKGIPNNHKVITSIKFERIDDILFQIDSTTPYATLKLDTLNWTTQEWIHFIKKLPSAGITPNNLKYLDETFALSTKVNAEIKTVWYIKCIQNDYTAIRKDLSAFLIEIGRRKFLEPIYEALANQSVEDKVYAIEVYTLARPNYHAISFNTVDEILGVHY
ncbi:aminopeptidase [Putridiphycobacter roseus]|uniref:Aminopeptidase N n=1 Tax=Putridiphycobacter roseus TaxID=2219161 RepID=A0A2W1N5Q3_9FLAO|nr:M1 family metallopeptidase [Putridiphycobacter roseus]PZE18471.1 aminopeptidase [Putridiphycobacter roseus]